MNFLDRALARVPVQTKSTETPGDWESDRGWTLVSGSAGDIPIRFDDLVTEGFRRNAVVNSCVRIVTQAVSEAPLYVYKMPKPGMEADDFERIVGHPAEQLFAYPNDRDPGLALIERMVQHYLLGGNGCLRKVRAGNRGVVQLHAVNPSRIVSAYTTEDNVPTAYRLSSTQTGAQRDYPAEDIVLIPDIDPLNEIFGMPRLIAAALNIRSDREADQYVAEVLHNHGSPGLVVGTSPEARPDALKRAEDLWEERFGPGRGRGKVAFAPGASMIKEIGFSLKDLEFPELRRITGERICGVIGVDPMLVSLASAARGGTLSGTEYQTAMRRLWLTTILPMLRRWEAYLNHGLAYEWGDVCFFFAREEIPALQEDRDAAVKRAGELAKMNVATLPEIRSEAGLEPEAPTGELLVLTTLGGVEFVPVGAGGKPKMPEPPKPAPAAPDPTKLAGGDDDDEPEPPEPDPAKRALAAARKVAAAKRPAGLLPAKTSSGYTPMGRPTMTREEKASAWLHFDAFAQSQEPHYRTAAHDLLRNMEQTLVGVTAALLQPKAAPLGVATKGITEESVRAWQRRMGVERKRYHKEWRDRFHALLTQTTQVVGGALAGDLGVSFDLAAPEVQKFLSERANLIAGASDEQFAAIRDTIAEGMRAGDSTKQLADRVQAVFNEGYTANGYRILDAAQRAALIARTEATAAANGGALAAARSTGLTLEKEWINRGDEKVRVEHQDTPVGVGGERVPLEERFSNGLDHPGDGDADDPAQVCNCRCGMLIHTVAAAA